MKFFKVEAKCGHVGRNHYVLKTFAVKAESGKQAASIVRNLPRVKHHKKDAICSVIEIGRAEYIQIINRNLNDPYFSCKNIQDQKICMASCVVYEEEQYESHKSSCSIKPVYYKKERLRNPQKFFRNYQYETRDGIC